MLETVLCVLRFLPKRPFLHFTFLTDRKINFPDLKGNLLVKMNMNTPTTNFRSHQHELLLFLLMSTSYNIPIEYGKKRSLRWREIKLGTKTRSAKPYMKKIPKGVFLGGKLK